MCNKDNLTYISMLQHNMRGEIYKLWGGSVEVVEEGEGGREGDRERSATSNLNLAVV